MRPPSGVNLRPAVHGDLEEGRAGDVIGRPLGIGEEGGQHAFDDGLRDARRELEGDPVVAIVRSDPHVGDLGSVGGLGDGHRWDAGEGDRLRSARARQRGRGCRWFGAGRLRGGTEGSALAVGSDAEGVANALGDGLVAAHPARATLTISATAPTVRRDGDVPVMSGLQCWFGRRPGRRHSPRRRPYPIRYGASPAVRIVQACLEEPPLGRVVGEGEGAAVRIARLVPAPQASQQLGAGRVEEVIAIEPRRQRLDLRQRGRRARRARPGRARG